MPTFDYAFVPGVGDKSLERLAELLQRLPDTITTLVPQPTALSTFFHVVNDVVSNMSQGPPGNLLIGAHGEEEGNWYLNLDGSTPIPATYETITNSTAIQMPAGIKGPLTWVRLKSCLLGADNLHPLLVAISRALGRPGAVTAPRYVHAHLNGYFAGIWEFMLYQFVVTGPDGGRKPLASRDAAKAAFADPANNFQLVDKTAVPAQSWDAWIPAAGSLNFSPALSAKATKPFSVLATGLPFGFPVSVPLETRWTSTLEVVPMPLLEADFIPVDDITIRDTLKDLLKARPEFQDTHPFPIYVRYGFKTLDDFTQAWNWKVDNSPGKTKKYALQYTGSRYRYLLLAPITKPGTIELVYNYYPDSGTPTVNFTETNDPFHLFGLV